jgi:hypothetical protein
VFFDTRSELVPGAGDQKMELYDAHECTRAVPCLHKASLACTGTGCQGVPPAPPVFAIPSSATFNGSGNYPPPEPAKSKSAAQLRDEALVKALKGCRAKKNKHKRAVCEAQTKKRYGSHKAKKSSRTRNAGVKRRAER